jgi:hypothetical protein
VDEAFQQSGMLDDPVVKEKLGLPHVDLQFCRCGNHRRSLHEAKHQQ